MKYTKLFLIGTLAALTVSCCRELENQQSVGITEISATFADGETKTLLDSDEETVLWCPNDEISVFYNTAGVRFTALNKKPASQTIFSSKQPIIFGGTEGSVNGYLYGIYPYSDDNDQDGDELTLTVSAEQTAVNGSFGNGCFPSVARSMNTNMAFYNVCGGLRFSLTRSDITKVVFSGRNGESLAGKVTVFIEENGKPSVREVQSPENEIVLKPGRGFFTSGKWYYLTAIPGSLANGFTLTFYTPDSHAVLEAKNAVSIKRSVFGSISNADSGLEYVPGGFSREIDASLYAESTKTSLLNNSPVWDSGQKVFIADVDSSDTPVIEIYSPREGKLHTGKVWGDEVFGGIPYMDFRLDNNKFLGCVPSIQDGSFNEAAISTAKDSGNGKLVFSPMTAILKVSTDVAVDSMRIKAINDASLSGTCYCEPFEDYFSTTSSIMVRPAVSSNEFYVGVIPGAIRLSFEVFKGGKVATKKMTSDRTVSRATLYSFKLTDLVFEPLPKNLSGKGTANCYIVSSAGKYQFKAVQGNTDIPVGDVKGVKVLWESFGTNVAPEVGDLIKKEVLYSDNIITFSTNDSFKEGNAVIAAYSDADCTDGNVLWSWHIWLTDEPEEQEYYNNAGIMMDRNLGATSAVPGDDCTMGLFYQWGRKDPFMGSYRVLPAKYYYDPTPSTGVWPPAINVSASVGTLEYVNRHPMQFILNNDANHDWLYSEGYDTDNTRWQTSDKAKGKYDPCPSGWRVPDGGENGVWATALGGECFINGTFDNTNAGAQLGTSNGLTKDKQLGPAVSIWYPTTGLKDNRFSGQITCVETEGYYFSCTPNSYYVYTCDVIVSGLRAFSGGCRSDGMAVRCAKDGFDPGPEPEFEYVDLGLSVKWATCNIGASKPEESGRHFAWGDVVGQTWDGAKWSGGGFYEAPKCEWNANGNLLPEYDAAHVIIGGSWRMPTYGEYEELLNNCSSIWTDNYQGTGVAGRILTSRNTGYADKSIFFPAAGLGLADVLGPLDGYKLIPEGEYWTRSVDSIYSSTYYARNFNFDQKRIGSIHCASKVYGFTIRPVRK